jgi:hypothetical protein
MDSARHRFRLDPSSLAGVMDELLARCLPSLKAHFEDQLGFGLSILVAPWLATLFAHCWDLPLESRRRIMDAYVELGESARFAVALALLASVRADLEAAQSIDEAMPLLEAMFRAAPPIHDLLRAAAAYKLSTDQVDKCLAKYRQKQA